MKLIDKEALVAEIERRNEKLIHTMNKIYYASNYNEWKSVAREYRSLISFLDTLEVKEVDLQEEPKTDWLRELQERLDSLSKEDFEKVMAKYSRYGEKGSIDYNKLNTMLDESLSTETKESWNKRLGEEPASEDLEEACEQLAENAIKHKAETSSPFFSQTDYRQGVMDGAKWQKEHLWKPADGDDLPEIDIEVIALLDNGKVVFAHRPPEYWDGKNIVTGKVTRHYPKTYDKGGWNIPNIVYWLDIELPKEIEL